MNINRPRFTGLDLCEQYFSENPQIEFVRIRFLGFVFSALVVGDHLPAMMLQDEGTVAMVNTFTGVRIICVQSQ